MTERGTITTDDGEELAFYRTKGRAPGVVFCGGFMSDMSGTKATALERHCAAQGRAYVRFDYRGHGESSGDFLDGTITGWRADALDIINQVTEGPQVIVGSSMGGWIALLAALARPDRIAGLIGIAAAPDFTEDLMWELMADDVRERLERDGFIEEPSEYSDEPYRISHQMILEGRKHLLLRNEIGITCPVRLLHGMQDIDVPWKTALRIAEKVKSNDVIVTLVKNGDHRLSDEQDIARLLETLDELCRQLEA